MIDIAEFESRYKEKLRDHISVSELLKSSAPIATTFNESDLRAIQQNFYNLIYYRCRNAENCIKWLDENSSELPKITNELSSLTESEWIGIPGMYGGFAYGLLERDGKPLLIADSWVRVVSGSGQSHEITPSDVTIVAEGYA